MEANAETYILGGQLLADVILTTLFYRLNAANDKRNRAHEEAASARRDADAKRSKEVDELRQIIVGQKGEVQTAAKALIDAEFRAVKHSVANHAQQLTSQMDKLAINFAERDDSYTKLFERNPHAELSLTKALNDLKDEVRDSTCSRQDFTDLREEHRAMKAKLDQMATLGDLKSLLQEARRA